MDKEERYEKVDDSNLKIIRIDEKVFDINQLLQGQKQAEMGIKQLEAQLAQAGEGLKKIKEIIDTAYKLGIKKPEPKRERTTPPILNLVV